MLYLTQPRGTRTITIFTAIIHDFLFFMYVVVRKEDTKSGLRVYTAQLRVWVVGQHSSFYAWKLRKL